MDRFILRRTDGQGFEWVWGHSPEPHRLYDWVRTFDGGEPREMSWRTAIELWDESPGTELVDTGDYSVVDYYVPEWDMDLRVKFRRDGLQDRIRKALEGVPGVVEGRITFRVPGVDLGALKALLLRVRLMLGRTGQAKVFEAYYPEDFDGSPEQTLKNYMGWGEETDG